METQVNESVKGFIGRHYHFELPVRWGDLDALNHVNNVVYHSYLEEARVNCLRAAGISSGQNGRNIVVAHASCDFLRPVLWPATLLVDMQLTRIGRTSLEYQADISIVGDTGGPCLSSRTVIVGTDVQTDRPAPWTDVELRGFEKVFSVQKDDRVS